VERDEAGGPASIPAPGRDSRVSQALLVAGALDRAKHFRMNENGPGSALDPTPGRTVRLGFGSPAQNSRADGNPHSHRNAAPIRPKLLAKAEGLAMIE